MSSADAELAVRPPGTRFKGRLNLFQRMMLRWAELHPYNPVHVVRIPSPLDVMRLRDCIRIDLERRGLTGLVVDPGRRRFSYVGGPAEVDLRVSKAEGDAKGVLAAEIERELNTGFAVGPPTTPFRFVAVDAGDGFHLVLTYDHFVAGGDSVALILNGVAETYAGRTPAAGLSQVLEIYPTTYRSLLYRYPLWILRAVAELPRVIAGTRRTLRPPNANINDLNNSARYIDLGPETLSRLQKAREAWGFTINEVLIAVVLQAIASTAAKPTQHSRRRDLAVASIVNLRRVFAPAGRAALSPFLASFRVAHPRAERTAFRELVQDVHSQISRIKASRLELASILALGLSEVMWPFLSQRHRIRFFAKHYPLWAGVTMLNVDALWRAGGADEAPFDYFRTVPTGPICPAVFAVTIARGAVHVCVSYRKAAVSPAEMEMVANAFVRSLEAL